MLGLPLTLLAAHFIGDFLLQSDWMATNKSKLWGALALHCAAYAACFLWLGPVFALVTFLTHFGTDAVTSRATSKLWFFRRADGIWEQASYTVPKHGKTLVNPWLPDVGNRHYFFVMIGFDQLIHAVTLALTWRYIVG